jgi:hypothetical protein
MGTSVSLHEQSAPLYIVKIRMSSIDYKKSSTVILGETGRVQVIVLQGKTSKGGFKMIRLLTG